MSKQALLDRTTRGSTNPQVPIEPANEIVGLGDRANSVGATDSPGGTVPLPGFADTKTHLGGRIEIPDREHWLLGTASQQHQSRVRPGGRRLRAASGPQAKVIRSELLWMSPEVVHDSLQGACGGSAFNR